MSKCNVSSIRRYTEKVYALGVLLCALSITVALIPACRSSEDSAHDQLELQKKQWVEDMREAFPDRTSDTLELKMRLSYFKETGNKIGQLMMYRVLGNEARASSQFRMAIENHTQGLQIAYDINDTINITVVLNDLGTDFRRIGAFNEATPYHYMALQIAEDYKGKDTLLIERNMASAYNGIGSVCRAMNESEEAIRVYRKALELETKHENYRGIAINYANIGAIYFSEGEYDKAEEYYQISLENNIKANLPMGIALCKINIGRIYEIQGDEDQALDQFEQAYDELFKTTDKWHWLDACFQVAEIHIKRGDYVKARHYLDIGLQTAQEINSLKHIKAVYELFSEYNYKLGNYKQSTDYLKASRDYADTLQRNLEVDRLLESRVKYETDKFTKQIEELDEINRVQTMKRRQVMILLIPMLVALFGLVLLLYYKRRLDLKQAQEIKNLERMRSTFFTNITHEFRTPMTVILGLTEQMRLRAGDNEFVDSLDTISRHGNSLLELINQLLDISKMRSEVANPDWKNGDIVAYINMLSENYRIYARQQMVDLEFTPADVSINMDFVPSYLNKIMRNLLSNAIKFTPRGGQIYLTVAKDKGNVVIRVADTGVGISAKDLPYIFNSFYQGVNSDSSTGTGVGLSLVRQMTEAMGGTVEVKSAEGNGSVFTLTIPLKHGDIVPDRWVPSVDSEKVCEQVSENVSSIPEEDSDTLSILIVEDNADVAGYIGSLLKDRYRLIFARNGSEGLEKAQEYMPDLILTDLMMPEMDGYEMCRRVRESEILNHIPIVIITAKSEDNDRIQGLEAGADAYLLKPFNAAELDIRVSKLLEQRRLLREKYSRALRDGVEHSVEILPADRDFLTRLTDTIYSSISNSNLTSEKLADKACMSQSQLNRKVKSITGYNTSAYVLQIRMERAQRLLASTETPIGEIADKCGFGDQSHFTRSFKHLFGMTPTQYRKHPR